MSAKNMLMIFSGWDAAVDLPDHPDYYPQIRLQPVDHAPAEVDKDDYARSGKDAFRSEDTDEQASPYNASHAKPSVSLSNKRSPIFLNLLQLREQQSKSLQAVLSEAD